MKFNILLLILVTTMVVFACNKKASQKTMNSEEVTQQQDPAEPAPEPTPEEKEEPTKADSERYVMLKFKKGPCYGKCPIYEANIYTDGTVKYTGKNFVDRIGDWESQIPREDVKMVRQKYFDAKFLEMANEYPTSGEKIADLPTTTIEFRVGDMIKYVKDKHDAPQELKELEQWTEAFLNGLKWTQVIKD